MSRSIIIFFITCICGILGILPAKSQLIREYTNERPLIIVSDWEFPPYEFRNDHGEPDGYNIEVLNLILNKLGIPHQFVMQEWYQAVQTFESHEADLIHALSINYRKHPYVMTQNMITYYPVKAVRRKSQKPLSQISQLGEGDTLMLKSNDYAALRIQLERAPQFYIEYRSPKEALTAIRNGRNSYYVWGEVPLKMKIREYALDSLILDAVDIPPGELRFIGYDKELIDAIDDTYARLEQAGDLQSIYDKWFYPERIHNDSSPFALFTLVGSIVAIIIIYLLSRLIRNRLEMAVNRSADINNIMKQALQMGNFFVLEYDIRSDHFRNTYGHMISDEGLSLEEFASYFEPSARAEFIQHIKILSRGENQQRYISRRFNAGTALEPEWRILEGNAIVEFSGNLPQYIVFALKDVTSGVETERINREMGNKYAKMFETNLIAMSFYSKDGWLIDVNEKMRELCGFDTEAGVFFRNTNMFDTDMLKGIYQRGSQEPLHVCNRMYYPSIKLDKYIEIRIRPISNDMGEIRFYVVTSRDISHERQMYIEQLRHQKEIQKTNEAISNYEKQFTYLLENSEMFVWRSDLNTHTLTYSHSLRKSEFTESMDDNVKRMYQDDMSDAISAINDATAMSKPFNVIHHYRYSQYSKDPVWYAISGIPTYDKQGQRIGYFGVSRDITKLMAAQQKLKMETERAENSGKMKSAFLANMTHEIRTPLNAIVGFSDLLAVIDTPEERMEFIRIIRNNCDMLMRLINDILEASSMGQALAIMPTEVDMAIAFDDMCQTLAQRVQEPGVEFIKDNPYQTCLTVLDKGRIQQVLTNFVTNAVKYTHQGHIKVGYHWDRRIPLDQSGETDGLLFYCIDTGAGIPKEKQASVFERFVKLNDFVQGTGLGLSICQAIADRCNGHIGVTSEGEGHGSTFWMWIPCEKKN